MKELSAFIILNAPNSIVQFVSRELLGVALNGVLEYRIYTMHDIRHMTFDIHRNNK